MKAQKQLLIKKYSGEQEPFYAEQLLYALGKPGEDKRQATDIFIEIKSRLYDGGPQRYW